MQVQWGAMNPPTPFSHADPDMLAMRRCITTLADLIESESPVVSAYFDLRQPRLDLTSSFCLWASTLRGALPRDARESFDAARDEVLAALGRSKPESLGLAVFSRSGANPFSMELSFPAPLETHFDAAKRPAIFQLVQLKDRFHRFVLAICGEDRSHIIEMTLGSVSQEIVATRPASSPERGQQLSQEHHHRHGTETRRSFIDEQVEIIRNLVARRGLNHLILAGHPRQISALRDHLPPHLQARIVASIFQVPNQLDHSPLIESAIQAFIQYEQQESRNTVVRLHDQIGRRGLAVVGIHPCRRALEGGLASELVISEELHTADREELVRLATSQDLPIEVCEGDELLEQHGGVGCLLRGLPEPGAAVPSSLPEGGRS